MLKFLNLGVLKQFLIHIERHHLCKTTDKILLAVSGGIDSMVMLHLFAEAGLPFGVAHCNFQLRGSDSIADERFVLEQCSKLGVDCHSKKFDTEAAADASRQSIQMSARALRYDYFNALMAEHGYNCIATAHHLDDALETFLLNFARGTGLDGLTGIPVKNGSVIRPLLFATRREIEEHAKLHKIAWREDASNAADDYGRNHIRHNIVPALKELNPNMAITFSRTAKRLKEVQAVVDDWMSHWRASSIPAGDSNDQIRISRRKLFQAPAPAGVLWHVLKAYGFSYVQCERIMEEHPSGKMFFSASHRLVVDRQDLIVVPMSERTASRDLSIQSGTASVAFQAGTLVFKEVDAPFSIPASANIACFDFSKVSFPLRLRSWKPGDTFMPLGMKNRKKISDFLIDKKLSLVEKDNTYVLLSGEDILWVVGHRIDERYKVTPSTASVLCIEFVADGRA